MKCLMFFLGILVWMVPIGCNPDYFDQADMDIDGVRFRPAENSAVIQKNATPLSIEGDTYIFDSDNPSIANLKQGGFLIGTHGEGYLRQVRYMKTEGSQVVVYTDPATMEDAFEKLHFHIEKDLTADDIDTQLSTLLQGLSMEGHLNQQEQPLKEYISFSLPAFDVFGIKVTGNVFMTIHILVDGQVDPFELTFTADTNVTVSLYFEMASGAQQSNAPQDFTLATLRLAPIAVGPVVLLPEIPIKWGVNWSVGPTLNSSVNVQGSYTLSVQCSESNPDKCDSSSTKDLSFNYGSMSQPRVGVSGSIKPWIGPQLNLKVYGVVGPYVHPKAFALFLVNTTFNPWWRLDAGVGVDLGVKFEIFSQKLFDWNKPAVINAAVTLVSANSSNNQPSDPVVTATPRTVSPSETCQLNCSAQDPDGDSLAFSWEAAKGTLSTQTGESVSWTAPAEEGDVQITCQVEDGKGGIKLDSVTVHVATQCASNCTNKACGDDGCGGSCGSCAEGQSCVDGQCDCVNASCGGNCCAQDEVCTPWQSCCKRDCGGKECGDDGCGGYCAPGCSGEETCTNGQCDCAYTLCLKGCCHQGQVCDLNDDTCCTRQCAGKECGDDGCGGSCGECDGTKEKCVNNNCCLNDFQTCEQDADCCTGDCCYCTMAYCSGGVYICRDDQDASCSDSCYLYCHT